MVYCEKGFGNKFIGNSFSAYQEGEIAFIGKNVPHLFKADDAFYGPEATVKPSSIVIQFVEDFWEQRFFKPRNDRNETGTFSFPKRTDSRGETRRKIKTILFEMLESDKIGRLRGLLEVFGQLSVSKELYPLSVNQISGINVNDSLKMNKVLEYALLHYKEAISIQEAADLTNLSESAFCRYFKSRTQKSFLSFIIEMRLNESRRLLKETDLSILEICYESGFNNLSNFNRLFGSSLKKVPLNTERLL